ncbi:hypothetical protein GCM10009066_07580 [Halarchaeum salinum]|uniref:Uncharacterized protein n=1 Tax=Halarchaeum salinum TaxID=489912 RepID=A0AAV3S4I0_9EURY
MHALDGLDDGAPIGVRDVHQHPVDVEYDGVDLHVPTSVAARQRGFYLVRATYSVSGPTIRRETGTAG